ncbi:MAG: tetratricopeptide repeat protein [Caldilineaceae bacterium]
MAATFSELLRRFMERDATGVRRLAEKSCVPEKTIEKWLSGEVRKPRNWLDLIHVAHELHLDMAETNALLQAARYPTLHALPKDKLNAVDRQFLAAFLSTVPDQPAQQTSPLTSAAPFQPFPDFMHFVGRTREIRAIKEFLQKGHHVAVCSVQGMGGVGKTTLATHLAYALRDHFVDGVLWAQVDASDPMATLAMFARALGEDVSQIHDLENRSAFVRGLLARKRVLVILDNATTSQQVRPLLPPTKGSSAAIITTRHDLAVTDTMPRIVLMPFDPVLGEAMALLASMLGADFVRQQNETLHTIVELLGHLPLAVSIAAARIRQAQNQLADYLAALTQAQQRLGALVREDVSVRLSFDVSYQRLPASLQRCFICLGVFDGDDFGVAAVAFVLQSSEETAAQQLAELHSFSLVQAGRATRYRLHPLLRDYAREHLAAEPALQRDALLRMIEYFVQFIERHTYDHVALDEELSNLFAAQEVALQQQKLELLVRAANGLALFLETRGLYEVAERQLQRARQAAEAIADRDAVATTLLYWGMMPMRRGDYAQAEMLFTEGLQFAYWAENLALIAHLERYLATVYFSTGTYDRAIEHNERSYAIAKTTDDERLLADSSVMLGTIYGQIGAEAHANELIHAGLALARKTSYARVVLIALFNLGNGAKHHGDWAQAETYWREGLEIARNTNHVERISGILANLGGLFSVQGEHEQAEAYLQEASDLARKIGHQWLMVTTLDQWGHAYLRQQKFAAAQAAFAEGLALAQTMNTRHLMGEALYGLAQTALATGDQAEAKRLGQASLALFTEIRYQRTDEVRVWLVRCNLLEEGAKMEAKVTSFVT